MVMKGQHSCIHLYEDYMSNGIGGRVQKIAVGVLIGLLVIGFAIWGVNDVFTPQNNNAVISIGDVDISSEEFESQFRRELQRRGRESGQQLTNQQAYDQGIHAQILQRMLTDAVVSLDANDLGIGVNRKTARRVVEEIVTFQNDITGEFSEDKLNEVLAQNRITRKTFEEDIYNTLRRQQTVPAIITGIQAPLDYATQRYKFLTEQRKVTVLTLDEKAVQSPEAPSDEVLKAYINENAATYTAPEYRKITMMRLENHDVTPNIEVSEDQIKGAYEYKVELGELGTNETRSVIQITATDEETANKAAERLIAGDTPFEITSSMGLIEPVYYTDVTADDIFDPETSQTAFALEEKAAKAILGSLGNWYAVQVTGITAATKPVYDDLKSELRTDLLNDLAEEKLYDITADIEDALTDGLTIEEVSERTNISVASFDFMDRTGVTPDGLRMSGFSIIPGIADDEKILIEVFTNDIGYQTDLFQTSTGGWATLRIDDIRDSKLKEFEEVKSEAIAAWKTKEIDKALGTLMVDLANRAKAGETLDDIAKSVENGAEIDEAIIVRSARSETIGLGLSQNLFNASQGDIERGEGVTPLTRQIAVLNEIISNNDALAGQFADTVQAQATNALSSDIQAAYQSAIIKENAVREYPENVKRVLGITTP